MKNLYVLIVHYGTNDLLCPLYAEDIRDALVQGGMKAQEKGVDFITQCELRRFPNGLGGQFESIPGAVPPEALPPR